MTNKNESNMNGKGLREAISQRFNVPLSSNTHQMINRAIRTMPGGSQTLDAIESLNAARNHAYKHRANEKIIAIDAAIDRVEEIREAMSTFVVESARGGLHHDE